MLGGEWFASAPEFANLDELNKYLLECCIRDREGVIEGRKGMLNNK